MRLLSFDIHRRVFNSFSAAAALLVFAFTLAAHGQQASGGTQPAVVQPGAPGMPTKALPPSTRAILPPRSAKDVEFMQGMIMHHAQAVEMTDMIESQTKNKEIRLLGARISQSQSAEIDFMRRWLAVRGEPTDHDMHGNEHKPGTSHKHGATMKMPGMLTKKQMDALEDARDAEFDRLFLTGMIQHHKGALVMVKELFDTAGSGQDSEIFNFATDVESGQTAEINIMETMLSKLP